MQKLIVLLVVFSLVFSFKSGAKPISFSIKINYGEADGKGWCKPEFGICSIIISLRAIGGLVDSGSETMEVKGEIVNNLFVINLPGGINEKGRNQRGEYSFSLTKELTVDKDLAKELGLETLVIAPGNYAFKGNSVALKIISPRDVATGQSNGKRLLPTVNKKDIAIDEPGIQKSTSPKSTGYDLKENKK